MAAVADTEGAMNEGFQLYVRDFLMDGSYLLGRQFARQHSTGEACIAQPANLGSSTIVSLSGSVEGNGGQIHLENAHVLHKDGMDSCLIQTPNELAGSLQLIVIDNRIDRDKDLHAKGTGIVAELANISNGIAHGSTCTKTLGTDVDSIGTVVNSGNATLEILGRGQQFQLCHDSGLEEFRSRVVKEQLLNL